VIRHNSWKAHSRFQSAPMVQVVILTRAMHLNLKWILETSQPVWTSNPPVHHKGWMISGQETVFCWVPVPYLTMVVNSAALMTKASMQPSQFLMILFLPVNWTHFALQSSPIHLWYINANVMDNMESMVT
jgi:hypothetical protein